MTKTSDLILSFIRDYIATNGYAPTVREIAKGVGLASTSTVKGHLDRLEAAGEIRRTHDARSITLAAKSDPQVTIIKHKNGVVTVLRYDDREYILQPPGMFNGMSK